MKNENYLLKTDNLYYTHGRRFIFSNVPVAIFGNSFDLTAAAMSFDLNTQIASFSGNVKGSFSEDLSI